MRTVRVKAASKQRKRARLGKSLMALEYQSAWGFGGCFRRWQKAYLRAKAHFVWGYETKAEEPWGIWRQEQERDPRLKLWGTWKQEQKQIPGGNDRKKSKGKGNRSGNDKCGNLSPSARSGSR